MAWCGVSPTQLLLERGRLSARAARLERGEVCVMFTGNPYTKHVMNLYIPWVLTRRINIRIQLGLLTVFGCVTFVCCFCSDHSRVAQALICRHAHSRCLLALSSREVSRVLSASRTPPEKWLRRKGPSNRYPPRLCRHSRQLVGH